MVLRDNPAEWGSNPHDLEMASYNKRIAVERDRGERPRGASDISPWFCSRHSVKDDRLSRYFESIACNLRVVVGHRFPFLQYPKHVIVSLPFLISR